MDIVVAGICKSGKTQGRSVRIDIGRAPFRISGREPRADDAAVVNLLLAVSFVLLLFVLLSLSNPYPDKMLSISLNPYHVEGETVNLRRTAVSPSRILPSFKFFSPLSEEYRFAAQDCSATTWKLIYTALHSNSRRTSVHHFSTTDPVKFNQIPHIQLVEGSYFIQYTNPLRAWSLREPE